MKTRRQFIKNFLVATGATVFGYNLPEKFQSTRKIARDVQSSVYRALNGSPSENLSTVIKLLGGIEKIIGEDDVVVIKPNVQWWNQGASNLSALKTFVDLIMNHPSGFYSEVVIAENCHRGSEPWKSENSGWMRNFERNSDLKMINNFNDLTGHLKKTYGNQFSTCHWIDIDAGGKRVFSPADGIGYVYCDGTGGVPLIPFNNGAKGDDFREVIMTYPIFKTDKGTIVDFKNGIWNDGTYTEQPLRFINFAVLNHHSNYCGATSAIKNYFGISDISGGGDGKLTDKYNNFHSFAYNKWDVGPVPGMLGAEVAVFMNTIRKADLNIIAAEWVGLASRTEPPVDRTRTVLASTDPVALDYHATKYILYPNSNIPIHNPDDYESPLHQYLVKCAEHCGGVYDEKHVALKSYDLKTKSFQTGDDLEIIGETTWGSDLKTLMKYLILRLNL